jgi:DNA-binding transcriptional regulator YhcF (GntR family)
MLRHRAGPAYLQLTALLRERVMSGEITSQVPSITALTRDVDLALTVVR